MKDRCDVGSGEGLYAQKAKAKKDLINNPQRKRNEKYGKDHTELLRR